MADGTRRLGAGVHGRRARVYPPLGNMAQLMRGIFFPNSNLIFTVQTRDPGAPAPPPSANQTGGFSFVDWGAGIYGGWELVDNAALALADASPLMLAPGIRCENGRLAPVTDPDWIKFTEELIAVSRRVYRLSQTSNQEAVAEATGDLSDACAACHGVYRESRGRGGRAPDPDRPVEQGRAMHVEVVGAQVTLIRRRPVDALDDKHLDWPAHRFQLQSELFLYRRHERRPCIVGIGARLRPPR